jgi:hypothetical protein
LKSALGLEALPKLNFQSGSMLTFLGNTDDWQNASEKEPNQNNVTAILFFMQP